MKSTVHWGVAHGLPTLFLRRAAARGDLQAQLIRVGSMGSEEKVFDLIEDIRSRGPLYRSSIGHVATSHAAVRQVLTSDDFRSGLPTDEGTARPDRPVGRARRRSTRCSRRRCW